MGLFSWGFGGGWISNCNLAESGSGCLVTFCCFCQIKVKIVNWNLCVQAERGRQRERVSECEGGGTQREREREPLQNLFSVCCCNISIQAIEEAWGLLMINQCNIWPCWGNLCPMRCKSEINVLLPGLAWPGQVAAHFSVPCLNALLRQLESCWCCCFSPR